MDFGMAQVIVLDSINEDIFVCGVCKSMFNSLEVFLNHKKIKCAPEVVANIFSEAFTSEVPYPSGNDNLTIHQEISNESQCVIESINFTCAQCGKKFKNRKTLGAHTKSHYMKPYQCLVCGRCFMQNSHLQRHVLSHKVWPESLSETTAKSAEVDLLSYSCPYCKVVFSNYNQFRCHLKNHQNMKKFKCIQSNCIYFFEAMDSLLHHVSSAHMEPVYTCYICNNAFNSLESVATHQQGHSSNLPINTTQGKQYKCSQCDAIFKKPEKLSLHMLTENHKKMCIHCNKTFASDKRLRLHLQTHKEIKPYQCSICNNSFQMKKYLTNHMLRHGKRDFKCVLCKTMFKRHDLLQRHMKLHQSNKLFKCPFKDTLDCKREFSRRDKLKLHIKSHTKHVANITCSETKEVNSEDCSMVACDG